MFMIIYKAEQLELCMYVNIHKKVDFKSQTSSLAIDFYLIKETRLIYNGVTAN